MFSPEGEQDMSAYASFKAPTPETTTLPTPEATAPAQPEAPEAKEKHEPTVEEIHTVAEQFGKLGKILGENTNFQLAIRLGMTQENFAAIQKKDADNYLQANIEPLFENNETGNIGTLSELEAAELEPTESDETELEPTESEAIENMQKNQKIEAQNKKYELQKLKLRLFDHLREFALKGHPGMEEPLAQSYEILNNRVGQQAKVLELAIQAPAGPERIKKITDLKKGLRLLNESRENLKNNVIKDRYPELWRKINGGEEEEEKIPVGPEFLSPEAWEVAAGAGLNYVATEIRPASGNRRAEISYLVYLDPDSDNLAPNLREQITEADGKILELEQEQKAADRLQKRAFIPRLDRLKKQAGWTDQAKTLRTRFEVAFGTSLNKAEKSEKGLREENREIVTELAGIKQMEYPNQVEAAAILKRLQETRPNEALAIYAQNEQGDPIMVAIAKTGEEIFTKEVDPDRHTPLKDTTLITPIGRRITPREAEDIKNMEKELKPGLARAA